MSMFQLAFTQLEEHAFDELLAVISNVLYTNDPMDTCCVENEAEDEYDMLAFDFAQTIKNYLRGEEIEYSDLINHLNDKIEENFGECFFDQTELKKLYDEIACHVCFYYGLVIGGGQEENENI